MTSQAAELDALKLALKMETDGYHFFKDASARTKNPLAKETLESFARWELEHIEYIKKMHKALETSGTWLSTENLSQKQGDALSAIKTIFKEKHEKLAETVRVNVTDLDAFRLARDIEDKATVFYRERADKATDKAAKKFYQFMIGLEREHYQILDNSYRYFENPEQWNIEDEGWMFDGG
ncbi:ferritin family protein [candidate division KSB1 bacterium]|nr:ferritin family protein [candidate division KSB1 bacterium]